MNLVTTCPDIPDNWKGGLTDVSRVLGLSRNTVRKYITLGRRYGGLDATVARSGKRIVVSGKEVKRFWREM